MLWKMVLKLDRMLFGLDPMKMFLLIPFKFTEQEGGGKGRGHDWATAKTISPILNQNISY